MSHIKVFNDFNIDNIKYEKVLFRDKWIPRIKFDDTDINYHFQSPWFQSIYFGTNFEHGKVKVIFNDNTDNEIFLEKMNKIDKIVSSNLKPHERRIYCNLIRKRENYEDEDDEVSSVTEYMKFRLNKKILSEDLEVNVNLKNTNIDGISTNEKIEVNNIEYLKDVLKSYSNFRFIFGFKNSVDYNNCFLIKPMIHSIQAKGKNNIFSKIYRGIESSSFECTICLQGDCTIKHKYKCCSKEICYNCYDSWKVQNSCPFCRSKIC